jgi:regulator of sirC expression with transglutaminase-like and TPR domain
MLPTESAHIANLARFARLTARPESEIDLAQGALLIAAEGRPELRFEPTLDGLERLAERTRIRLDRGDPPSTTLDRLNDMLFAEAGFRGPTAAEYGDADNSLFDRVVARRIGLPISLAIVELEVAWRIGLPLHGVGMPGHFLVGSTDGSLIDPTSGRLLMPDDCQALLRRALGDRILFHSSMLRPTGRREILARVLRNLRTVRLAERDWPAALGVVDLLAVVEPVNPDHGRDRGVLLGRVGRFSEAIVLLSRYVDERPDEADADDVRQVIGIFRGRRN